MTAPERTADRPAARLRAAGLRATRPRLLVLSLLEGVGGHQSADDVAAALVDAGTPLPRASVYNVLRDLVDHGVAMSADAGPGRALYEVADEWHHHFVCRRCGQMRDVECVVGARPCLDAPDASLAGAVVDEAQVIFRGLCPACAAAA